MITIKMPESPDYPDGQSPSGDDYVWCWDVSTGKLRKSKVSDLPFSGGGGGGGGEVITNPSPFMVFNNSASYSYDAGTNTVTISDTRLKNRTFYPVLASQVGGGEINPELVTYSPIDPDDDTKGQVIITGFQLDDGHHLSLIVPGNATSSDTTYTQLLADVANLKLMLAPFTKTVNGVNGGKVWWEGLASEIPVGWQECVAMRGYFPMHRDPDDADFDGDIGDTGGSKTRTLDNENMFPHAHKQGNEGLYDDYHDPDSDENGGYIGGRTYPNNNLPSYRNVLTKKSGGYINEDGDLVAKPFSIINKFKIGLWIEFIGI